jgi:hypothetical protein
MRLRPRGSWLAGHAGQWRKGDRGASEIAQVGLFVLGAASLARTRNRCRTP